LPSAVISDIISTCGRSGIAVIGIFSPVVLDGGYK
jgi:hypothetical protein